MSIGAKLVDGKGSGAEATVLPSGQLAVGPLAYSVPTTISLAVAAQVYNFFQPIAGKEYVITDIIVSTNKDVGADGATIDLYESESATSGTATKTIISLNLAKNDDQIITGLNWLVTEGVFINADTDDNISFMTVAAFTVPTVRVDPSGAGKGADA